MPPLIIKREAGVPEEASAVVTEGESIFSTETGEKGECYYNFSFLHHFFYHNTIAKSEFQLFLLLLNFNSLTIASSNWLHILDPDTLMLYQ